MEQQCQVAEVSRAGFYRYFLHAAPKQADLLLRARLQELAVAHHRLRGYRMLNALLQREGQLVNHKRVLRLMEIRGHHLSPAPHEHVFFRTIDPPVVAFHNSLDDTIASITPGTHKSRSATHFIPLQTGIPDDFGTIRDRMTSGRIIPKLPSRTHPDQPMCSAKHTRFYWRTWPRCRNNAI